MKFSIIIINYKTPQLTSACLKSLFALPGADNREIIVIDNASEDGSAEKLSTEFGNSIQLIANRRNLGFAGANNQGAALAQGEFLLFLNSDTIVNEDIFSVISELFRQNYKLGIISPRLLLDNGEAQPVAWGRFPTLWRLIARSNLKKPVILAGTEILEVDWVSGCALAIRKKLFEELGGWDDHFFLYFEDVDLCKRALGKGYKSVVALNTNITHLGGRSLALSSERKKHYYQAQDYYFRKNFGKHIAFMVKALGWPMRVLNKF